MSHAMHIKLLKAGAQVPVYAKPGDSGADLASLESAFLYPGDTHLFWVGIAIELPVGCEAQIRPRSSLSRRGVMCHLGTIDTGYRGELGVVLTNVGKTPYEVKRGDRIAQLVVAPVLSGVEMQAVEELSSSERGSDGFGSSDRKAGNGG